MDSRSARRRELAGHLHGVLTDLLAVDPGPTAEAQRRSVLSRHGLGDDVGASSALPPLRRRISVQLSLSHLFGSATSPTEPPDEIELVRCGPKPVSLSFAPTGLAAGWLCWAEERGLWAVLTAESYPTTAHPTGFQQLGSPGSSGTGADRRGLLVARTERELILAWVSQVMGWDAVLGRLLGFPGCCVELFARHWEEARTSRGGELFGWTLEASGPPPYPWVSNVATRYFGPRVIHHFPCRLECEPTRQLGLDYAAALARPDPAGYARRTALLHAPAVWTDDTVVIMPGAAVVTTATGTDVTYDTRALLSTTPQSALMAQLSAVSRLTAEADGSLVVDGHRRAGRVLWFV